MNGVCGSTTGQSRAVVQRSMSVRWRNKDTRMAYSQAQTMRRRAPRDFLGHPPGLAFLFSTEMWERFSYYGMRSLLVLSMVKYLLLAENADNVIGLTALRSIFESMFGPLGAQPFSSHIYGLYTGLVYFTPFFGGLLADRV